MKVEVYDHVEQTILAGSKWNWLKLNDHLKKLTILCWEYTILYLKVRSSKIEQCIVSALLWFLDDSFSSDTFTFRIRHDHNLYFQPRSYTHDPFLSMQKYQKRNCSLQVYDFSLPTWKGIVQQPDQKCMQMYAQLLHRPNLLFWASRCKSKYLAEITVSSWNTLSFS